MKVKERVRAYGLSGAGQSSPGLYFITIAANDRKPYFGKVKSGIVRLSVPGCIAWHYWRQIPVRFDDVRLDEFIVMPNHVHGIIEVNPGTESPVSLSSVIDHYKAMVVRWCERHGYEHVKWQSRFYDHRIADQKSLVRVREYIRKNPWDWIPDSGNLF